MRNLRTFSGVAGFVTLVVNLILLVDVHFDEDGLDVEKEEEDPKILEPNPIPTPCLELVRQCMMVIINGTDVFLMMFHISKSETCHLYHISSLR